MVAGAVTVGGAEGVTSHARAVGMAVGASAGRRVQAHSSTTILLARIMAWLKRVGFGISELLIFLL